MKFFASHFAATLLIGGLFSVSINHAAHAGNPYNLKPMYPQKSKQQAEAPRNYVGVSMGQSSHEGCAGLIECDDNATSWKVYSGVRLADGIMLEAGYVDLGETQGKDANGAVSSETKGYTVAGVVELPVMDQFSLLGKVGIFRRNNEYRTSTGTQNNDGNSTLLGIGAQYNMSGNLGLRAEWERYSKATNMNGAENDMDQLSVGITFSSL